MSTDDELHPVTGKPMFYSIGRPIAPLLVWGIVAMAAGSFIALFLGEEFGLLVGAVASLGGIIAIAIGVARLADAVQYLAMRERDREHSGD